MVRKDSLKEEEIEENLEEDNANDTVVQGTTILPFDVNSVPAANIYPCWNNLLVNPYHIALDNYADSTFIDVSGYVHPIVGRITSDFGFRRWRYHFGTDIKLQIGDSLHASFDGMIRIAKKGKGFGNYIVIRHSNGLETVYGHLSKILVNVNQPVKAGQIIGLGGNTGRSTGPNTNCLVK